MIFSELSLDEQVCELKTYFKKLGADISVDKSRKGLEDDVHKIIGICELCFKEPNENDIETVLNDVVSLIVVMEPSESTDKLTLQFVEKLSKTADLKYGAVCLRVLWVLFQSIHKKSAMRYHIYYHLLKVAQEVDMVCSVFRSIKQLKEHFAATPLSTEQTQRLLRLLHGALVKYKHSDIAAKVMIELLSTYTSENAGQAKEDAQRCIVTALADPKTFLLDPLLSLKPIKFLKGELIHDLLTIFVSEKLSAYTKFYKTHKTFVTTLGLDHSQNLKKMQLLTFMQLAEKSNEIAFETIQKELNIPENEVESFIIEALKTKLVRARMDQTTKKVHISSTMHRTFGFPQWQQLRDILQTWKLNLNSIDESMKVIVNEQQKNTGYHSTMPAM